MVANEFNLGWVQNAMTFLRPLLSRSPKSLLPWRSYHWCPPFFWQPVLWATSAGFVESISLSTVKPLHSESFLIPHRPASLHFRFIWQVIWQVYKVDIRSNNLQFFIWVFAFVFFTAPIWARTSEVPRTLMSLRKMFQTHRRCRPSSAAHPARSARLQKTSAKNVCNTSATSNDWATNVKTVRNATKITQKATWYKLLQVLRINI